MNELLSTGTCFQGRFNMTQRLFMETTKIDVERTVSEIQKTLGQNGATSILIEYEKGEVSSLFFRIRVKGSDVPFRLPCRSEQIYQKLIGRMKKIRESRIDDHKTQAKRVAWRQVLRWVQAQLALVETEMVTMEEVFLPYMQGRGGKTLYELMSNNNFKMLEAPK